MPNTTSTRHAWRHGLHRKQPNFGQGKSEASTSTSRMFFSTPRYLKHTTFSCSAGFTQHHINSRASPIRRILSKCNTKEPQSQHITTQSAHITWTREKKTRNLRTWSRSKTGISQCVHSKVWWKNCQGTGWNNVPHTLKTTALSLRTMPSADHAQKGSSKTWMTVKTRGSSGTHFLFAPVPRFFAPVSRVFSPVSRKILWSYQAQNVNIMHVKAGLMQRAIFHQANVSLNVFPRVHGQTLSCSHATGRLILPGGVSTNSPMHESSNCASCRVTHGQGFKHFTVRGKIPIFILEEESDANIWKLSHAYTFAWKQEHPQYRAQQLCLWFR